MYLLNIWYMVNYVREIKMRSYVPFKYLVHGKLRQRNQDEVVCTF